MAPDFRKIGAEAIIDGRLGEECVHRDEVDIDLPGVRPIGRPEPGHGSTADRDRELRAGLGLTEDLADVVSQFALRDGTISHELLRSVAVEAPVPDTAPGAAARRRPRPPAEAAERCERVRVGSERRCVGF